MYKLTLSLVVLVFSLMVTGCATNSVQGSGSALTEKVSKLEKGKATYAEAIALLGNPLRLTMQGNGSKLVLYHEGFYSGVRANMVFDANDILISKVVDRFGGL